jgi:hypothetical protein
LLVPSHFFFTLFIKTTLLEEFQLQISSVISLYLPLAMVKKLKSEMCANNGLPPSVLSGRVSRSSSGDRRVPWLRKTSMVWIWQHDKRTDEYKIILNLYMKIEKKI